jgi:secreted Zn-dependent insulinase-like peptidase
VTHRIVRFTAFLLAPVLATLLGACSGSTPAPSPESEVRVPVTGAIDDRDYRHLVLDNGLEVLVVSAPDTDKSAAALAVDVGSFAEPDDRLGLAHFLEHMLFLGTEKYPSPDEYGEFISRHGGSRNAYTALDHTNYFFSIAAGELYGGLDRFAQFFVAPLFTSDYVDREKNAVQSEYQLQLRDDGWRTYMTQKRALNPEHPGSRFTIGSLETLADRDDTRVRDELLRFYRDHYSADRMSLVILGREDTETLADWARELFAAVPRRDTEPVEPVEPVLRDSDVPSLLRMQPVKERRVLEISFGMPGSDARYRTRPGDYLANLLGHEGAGSLHAELNERGWIESLSAGSNRFGEHNSVLSVTLNLTEQGYAHWREAGALLFAWIDRIAAEGIEPWRHAEQARLARLAFDYREPSDPFRRVADLASNMLIYPPEEVVRGPFLMDEYDAAVIRDFAGRMRPERAQVSLTAPDVETRQVEPWFEVPYSLEPLPDDVLEQWRAASGTTALQLPDANPFIPEDLSLLADGDERPEPLIDAPGVRVWHLTDTSFGAPRAQLRIDLRTPRAGATAADAVNARLFSRLVTDDLTEFAYPARLAGLSYGLSASGDALTLSLGGFDDRLDVLLERVVETLVDPEMDTERFERFRNELLRDLRNSRDDRPYQQTMAEMRRLLEVPNHPLDALIAATEAADLAGLESWMDAALAGPELVGLFHGNLDPQRARQLVETLRTHLDTSERTTPGPALVRLEAGDVIQRRVEVEHDDAALSLYVQGRDRSWAERARFGLLAHMMSAPYFNALRTERQLGYVVAAGPWVRVNTPGLFFLVQSPVAPPAVIEEATRAFVESFGERLEAMSAADFEAERAGLLSRVLEADQNLGERTGRFWSDLEAGIETFDSRDRVAEAIRELEPADMRAFHAEFVELLDDRRAATWSAGRFPLPDAAPGGREIRDLPAFKAGAEHYRGPATEAETETGTEGG